MDTAAWEQLKAQRTGTWSRPVLLLLWMAVGLLLAADLWTESVDRTQEARVLETAREMLGTGWDGWMIPHLGGEVRLHKPPLAYWMAAGAFKVLGVSEAAGRLPFVLAGWLLIGVTYAAAKSIVGGRAALFSAACLAGSYLFFRFTRLAETDGPSALFVTIAVWAMWKARLLAPSPGTPGEGRGEGGLACQRPWLHEAAWFHLSSLGIGLAALSKGPPAAFPILLLLAWAIVNKDWRLLGRWVRSGAPITALVIGLSWFGYVWWEQGWKTFGDELQVAAAGVDHYRPFYYYVPEVLVAMAPWSGLAAIAIAAGIAQWKDLRVRWLLLWAAAVFVPLCIVGNKQRHYLFPLLPPLAMLTGWWIDRLITGLAAGRWLTTSRIVWVATVASVFLMAPALLIMARLTRGQIVTSDLVVAVIVLASGAAVLQLWRQHGLSAGLTGFAAFNIAILFVLVGRWAPSLETNTPRVVGLSIRQQFGEGPYCFYGENVSLPVNFYLREVVPQERAPKQLRGLEARLNHPWIHPVAAQWAEWAGLMNWVEFDAAWRPELVLIAQTKNDIYPPPVPASFELKMTLHTDDGHVFRVYRKGRDRNEP